jgi:hypothetical protein
LKSVGINGAINTLMVFKWTPNVLELVVIVEVILLMQKSWKIE